MAGFEWDKKSHSYWSSLPSHYEVFHQYSWPKREKLSLKKSWINLSGTNKLYCLNGHVKTNSAFHPRNLVDVGNTLLGSLVLISVGLLVFLLFQREENFQRNRKTKTVQKCFVCFTFCWKLEQSYLAVYFPNAFSSKENVQHKRQT